MTEERVYRQQAENGLEMQHLVIGETDLAIYLPEGIWNEKSRQALADELIQSRSRLQAFICRYPEFASSHSPLILPDTAPPEAVAMARAAAEAGVGPMAAVAGFFAGAAGRFIVHKLGAAQVIVENGGDIYIEGGEDRNIGIFAGEDNPFSGRLAAVLKKELFPCGVCTSSGTLGSSFSYGKADAAMVVAADPALADAAATAAANRVNSPEDVELACDWVMSLPGIKAALIICETQLAAAGELELCSLG